MIVSEQRDKELEDLEHFLRSYGYLPPERHGVMIAALAKWFHVNQSQRQTLHEPLKIARLGELTVFPFYKSLSEASWKLISSHFFYTRVSQEAFERFKLEPSRGSGF